jgi:hypothetical protein
MKTLAVLAAACPELLDHKFRTVMVSEPSILTEASSENEVSVQTNLHGRLCRN